jgi:hypothetical protein
MSSLKSMTKLEDLTVLSNYTYRKKSSRVWKLVEEIGNGKRKFSGTILVSERERKDCMHNAHVRHRLKSDRQVGRETGEDRGGGWERGRYYWLHLLLQSLLPTLGLDFGQFSSVKVKQ